MKFPRFFDGIRGRVSLTPENVQGIERIIDHAKKRGTPLNQAAYVLATALWETNFRAQPVVEAYWLSEDWRRRNLRYYPWHGRGLIQTTWKDNYEKLGKLLGHDFTKNPDDLLDWKWAIPALFVGMEEGLYTGKALDDYIDEIDESDAEDSREYRAARRIVNGTDKAASIANLALVIEHALRDAGYGAQNTGDPLLSIGAKGDAVRRLQELLKKQGKSIAVDGDFGPQTELTVALFQSDHFDPRGVVGSHTWKLLKGD